MKTNSSNRNKTSFKQKLSKILTKKNIKDFIFGSSTGRKMFRLYFLILLFSAILLYLPFSFQAYFDYGYGEHFNYAHNHYLIALQPNVNVFTSFENTDQVLSFNFFDCLFMSFSGFSDTGLSLFSLSNVFSIYGKIVLMLVIQIGGFGIMFFIFLFWKLFLHSDHISVNQTLLAQSEKGNTKLGNTEKMLITSSLIIIFLEILFAFYYSLWFMLVPSYEQVLLTNPEQISQCIQFTPGTNISDLQIYVDNPNVYSSVYHHAGNAFFAGFFHSVSVVNNAGFDILGPCSLSGFKNGVHTIFLMVTAFQFIIGGIGFPVIFDIFSKWSIVKTYKIVKTKTKNVKKYRFKIQKNKNYNLSLFSKLTLSTYLIVVLLGIFFSFIFEATAVGGNHYLWDSNYIFGNSNSAVSWYNKSVNIIFQSLSTRSAGYFTFDNQLLNTINKWLNITLMFIGGSASSTAGGIRVTTLAIIAIVVFKKIKGSKRYSVFKRNLTNSDIMNSFIVFVISIVLITIGGVILISDMINNEVVDSFQDTNFTDAIFMCTSAFGTTGLSVMNLQELHWWSLLYLMILMFIGQYGVSTTILAIRRSKVKENYFNYIYESVKIG